MANTRTTAGDQQTLDNIIGDSLTTFEESEVTRIIDRAFYGKKQLRTITLPNVKTIGDSAFQNSNIETINVPSLEEIGTNTFANCTELTECTFPSLKSMNTNAFSNCTKLQKLDIGENSTETTFLPNCVNECTALSTLIVRTSQKSDLNDGNEFRDELIGKCGGAIYVPSNLVSDYKADTNWGKYPIAPISSYPLSDYSTITDSWEDILAAENDGTYLTKYRKGDTKSLTIDGNKVYMQIAGFNVDPLATGSGTAKITWVSVTSYFQRRMNPANSNNQQGTGAVGGWEYSELRDYLRTTFKSSLPSTIRNAIVDVNKYTTVMSVSGVRDTAYVTVDDVWIPSYREYAQESSSEVQRESTGPIYYDYENVNRYRYELENHNRVTWLTRSTYDINRFIMFGSEGAMNVATLPDQAKYVIFGFCT